MTIQPMMTPRFGALTKRQVLDLTPETALTMNGEAAVVKAPEFVENTTFVQGGRLMSRFPQSAFEGQADPPPDGIKPGWFLHNAFPELVGKPLSTQRATLKGTALPVSKSETVYQLSNGRVQLTVQNGKPKPEAVLSEPLGAFDTLPDEQVIFPNLDMVG